MSQYLSRRTVSPAQPNRLNQQGRQLASSKEHGQDKSKELEQHFAGKALATKKNKKGEVLRLSGPGVSLQVVFDHKQIRENGSLDEFLINEEFIVILDYYVATGLSAR